MGQIFVLTVGHFKVLVDSGTQAEIDALFLEKGKIALNAGATFGESGEGFMRMNLACPMATVDEGLKRIQTAAS